MSDYSLDDILNEIDSKKKTRGGNEQSAEKRSRPSITEELAQLSSKKAGDYSLDEIVGKHRTSDKQAVKTDETPKKSEKPSVPEKKSEKTAEKKPAADLSAAENTAKKQRTNSIREEKHDSGYTPSVELPAEERKAASKKPVKQEKRSEKQEKRDKKQSDNGVPSFKKAVVGGSGELDMSATAVLSDLSAKSERHKEEKPDLLDKLEQSREQKLTSLKKTLELEKKHTLEINKLRASADTADLSKQPAADDVKQYKPKKKEFVVNIDYDEENEDKEAIPQPLAAPRNAAKPEKKSFFARFSKARNEDEELSEADTAAELKQLEENLEKNAEAERLKAEKEAEKQQQRLELERQREEKQRHREQVEKEREEARQQSISDELAKEEAEKQRLIQDEKQRIAEENRKRAEFEASEKRMTSKNIVLADASIEFPWSLDDEEEAPAPVEPTTAEIQLAEEQRREKQRREDEQRLQRDKALQHPDDFLNAINPYDLSPSGLTSEFETLPAENLAGDTISVAGNDLKELSSVPRNAERITDEEAATIVLPEIPKDKSEEEFFQSAMDLFKNELDKQEEDDSEIKEYNPQKKQSEPKSADAEKYRRSDDALLESLNRKIERKRESDVEAARTLSFSQQIPPVATHGLNIDYNKKIIPATGTIPVEDPVIEEAKVRELAAKKKHKIKDFVLEDVDDDEDYYDSDDDDEEEFDDYDSAGQIWSDLTETHKSLKTRFSLLLILTLALGIITLLSDMGTNLTFDLFGNTIMLFEKRSDATGFTFFNMILGIIGIALCSSVIVNGLKKLFTLKADCDSVCATTVVFSLVSSIMYLTNADLLIQSRAYIYIAVGLFALMFNTLGKLSMITRAKRNFRFISGDSHKYYAYVVENDSEASAFTKGVVTELPFLVTMRKTEYLTDFLKKSYSDDKADKISKILAPASIGLGLLLGVIAYFLPNGIPGMENSLQWAVTVALGTVAFVSPFSIMFLVNYPLARASKALSRADSVVLGYAAVEDFCGANAIMTDALLLFPSRSIECTKIKLCRQKNSMNNIAIDQAIILAASLAIESGSILSNLFYDMIGGKKDMLATVEGCVFEDNMGVMGWYGNKRLILGNREQMKHHSIKVPEMASITQYCVNNAEAVYLAVGGELTVIFFIRVIANTGVKSALYQMMKTDISLVVKTTDSLVSVNKLADVFDIDPERVKVLPYGLHENFTDYTKYSSRGSAAISCGGTFSSFAKAVVTAKKLMREINITSSFMLAGIFLGAILSVIFTLTVTSSMFSPTTIIAYNLVWMAILLIVQSFRRY